MIHLFSFQIFCKGALILSGISKQRPTTDTPSQEQQSNFTYDGKIIPRRTVNNFDFTFNVTTEMVPKCKVLVYFVKLDREIVADSVEYKVEEKLENQVKITVLKLLPLYGRD